MPKTIAITPSWYWPAGVPRVVGVPPFSVTELLVGRRARREPDAPALVDDGARLTNRELADAVEASGAGADVTAVAGATPTVAGAVALLGALAADRPLRLDDAAATFVDVDAAPAGAVLGFGDAWHSQRSLLASALSFAAFFGASPARPWCTTEPLTGWSGVLGLTVALASGAPVVLAPAGPVGLDAVAREGVGVLLTDLASAAETTRSAKREVKAVRGTLDAALVTVAGAFDADPRRRVARMFGCPALTVFGLPETGPVFASHASWYVDEAVGIPLTNAHVVPLDPYGAPLTTLWELVESAQVSVWSPMCALGTDGPRATGVVASSDANGMVYLLPG